MNRMTHIPALSARFVVPCLLSLVAATACGESSSPSEGTSTSTLGTSSNTTAATSTATTTSTGPVGTTSASTGSLTTGGATGTTSTAATSTAASGGTGTTGGSGASGTSDTTTTGASGGSGTSSAATTSTASSDTESTSDGASGTSSADPSSGSVFHIFMLMGQSNMAGVAKAEASDMNTDERIKVFGGCDQPANQWNIANPPLNDCPGLKGWNSSGTVDPGIWFAKTIVQKLPAGDTIGFIGTAESGEAVETFMAGGPYHQSILDKISKVKATPNTRFAGVIFHQGESNSGQADWPNKVVQLYNQVKAAWGVDYDVPFILGELPAGGCCSGHNVRVHEAADKLPIGAWVSQEGTKVMDEYHFDHASVVLMGKRYGEKMIELLGW